MKNQHSTFYFRVLLLPLTIVLFGAFCSGNRSIGVRLISTHISFNNGVGNEWSTFLMVRDSAIQVGELAIFELEKRAPLIIEAHAVESDKNYSDEGSNSMIFTYSDLIAIEESRFEINVKVMENGGQQAGNLAEWIFLFELTGI